MTAPLDPAQDPDRFDPARDATARPGEGQTLPGMLGAGAYDDTTSPYLFLLGLLGVLSFLALVALFFTLVGP